MPGAAVMSDRAWAARVPLPLRRPARRRGAAGEGAAGAADVGERRVAAAVRLLDPRGRPGPRLTGAALAPAVGPPTCASAVAPACRRLYSLTTGLSSASRPFISRRFSSRKSVTAVSLRVACCPVHRQPTLPGPPRERRHGEGCDGAHGELRRGWVNSSDCLPACALWVCPLDVPFRVPLAAAPVSRRGSGVFTASSVQWRARGAERWAGVRVGSLKPRGSERSRAVSVPSPSSSGAFDHRST